MREIVRNKLPWLILILTYCSAVIFFWFYGEAYLDSDMASEMVLANQLNAEGSIFSSNWFYSTEIRMLDQQLFFRLFLPVFPNNWHLVRTIAQAIQLAMVAGGYLFLTSSFGDRRLSVFLAAMLMCPFGFWQMFHVTFDGFYLMHMFVAEMTLGGMIKALWGKSRGNRLISIMGICILTFVVSLKGVRGLMSLYVPFAMAALIMLLCSLCSKKESLNLEIRFLAYSILLVVIGCAGYFVNVHVLAPRYPFHNYQNVCWKTFDLDEILANISVFLSLFGYPVDELFEMPVELFSPIGILSCFSLLFMAIIVLLLVRICIQMHKLDDIRQVAAFSAIMSLCVSIIVFSLTTQDTNGSYFLPILPLIVGGVLQMGLEATGFKNLLFRNILIGALAVSVSCCSAATVGKFLKMPVRSNPQMMEVASYLLEHNYEKGMAYFWDSNVVTELTDGQVEMWTIIGDEENFAIYEWLQSREHVQLPEGKCFLLLQDEKEQQLGERLQRPGIELERAIGPYRIFSVEDAAVLSQSY